MKLYSSIIRWIPLVIIAFALVSVVALLQLDGVVNGDLYSHGLQFSLVWANRYWLLMRTALVMLSLTIVTAMAFQISMILQKSERKTKGKEDASGELSVRELKL